MVFADWSVTGQVFSPCSWSWSLPPGFAAFLGLELKYNWGLDVISREERLPLGWGPYFTNFAPCQALGALALVTICTWLNCLATLFVSLSVSLFHLLRNFPSFSLSCLKRRTFEYFGVFPAVLNACVFLYPIYFGDPVTCTVCMLRSVLSRIHLMNICHECARSRAGSGDTLVSSNKPFLLSGSFFIICLHLHLCTHTQT